MGILHLLRGQETVDGNRGLSVVQTQDLLVRQQVLVQRRVFFCIILRREILCTFQTQMCGKVISISRPHDSEEMGTETWRGSDEGEREGQELSLQFQARSRPSCVSVSLKLPSNLFYGETKKKICRDICLVFVQFSCVHVRSYVCMRHERILKGGKISCV